MKEEFYAVLQETKDRVPRSDRLVVLGDLNARVGCNCDVWGDVIGRHGEVEVNDNGKRLLKFCACNALQVMNTWFQHKLIHKFTWECKGRGVRSIIDYFLVRKCNRADVQDMKVLRGAEIGSDHYLVLMKMKMKAMSATSKKGRQGIGKIQVNKLNDRSARISFTLLLKEKIMKARYLNGEDVEKA